MYMTLKAAVVAVTLLAWGCLVPTRTAVAAP